MTQHTLTKALQQVLVDSYALYLKTQNYHWNVTGPNFNALHSLFEQQYTDLAEAIDEIAERIRALGEKVSSTFYEFNDEKSITDADPKASATDMVQQLADDQQTIIAKLQAAKKIAETSGDDPTMDFMIDRIRIHEKNQWMLRSSL